MHFSCTRDRNRIIAHMMKSSRDKNACSGWQKNDRTSVTGLFPMLQQNTQPRRVASHQQQQASVRVRRCEMLTRRKRPEQKQSLETRNKNLLRRPSSRRVSRTSGTLGQLLAAYRSQCDGRIAIPLQIEWKTQNGSRQPAPSSVRSSCMSPSLGGSPGPFHFGSLADRPDRNLLHHGGAREPGASPVVDTSRVKPKGQPNLPPSPPPPPPPSIGGGSAARAVVVRILNSPCHERQFFPLVVYSRTFVSWFPLPLFPALFLALALPSSPPTLRCRRIASHRITSSSLSKFIPLECNLNIASTAPFFFPP
ncbi:hypothetical protein B0T19DRAFT_132410 [Cercophora scortea]|uniref:Uncharacterized protein n=1 Tax=Cercophora scortea TaxID=314031 RepID=A0AAE0IYP9_9PEZI|nr:hypothetical protein B0T19DRAFT_132410 [Cercophora scortea]